jgi:predicted kinase
MITLDKFIKEYPEGLCEGIEDQGIFKAVFMAGTAGSGKSYTLSKIKSGSIEPRIVNTDKFKEFFGKWDKPTVLKSKKLTASQLYLYLNSMLPLFVDGTSAWSDTLKRRRDILSEIGYDTAMVFVSVPLEVAIKRARERKRPVPEDFVREAYQELNKLKSSLKSKFKLFIEINNDEGELTNDVILKAYKKISFFYSSPIKNPRGNETIRLMRENGWKYLVPNVYDKQELQSLSNKWYKSTSEGEEYEMKIRKYFNSLNESEDRDITDTIEITEEKIVDTDKNKIQKALDAEKKTSFELKSYKKKYPESGESNFEIIHANNKSLTIEFNLDFIDLQYWLQDYCDTKGWETTSGSERRSNIFWMKIKK